MDRKKVESVEDLVVFRRAYALSLEVHRATLEFPKIEQYALANQLRRSTKSICANITEGFGKQRLSAAEYRRYLMMAIGSSDESQLWLSYCADLAYVDRDKCQRWIAEYSEISRMLQGIVTRWSAPS